MRITIEVDSKNELEKLSAFFKTLKINIIEVTSNHQPGLSLIKGDKKIDPNGLFGIWAKKPKSIGQIRELAWHRKA